MKRTIGFLLLITVCTGSCKQKREEKEIKKEVRIKPKTIIGSWQLFDQSAESDTKKTEGDKLLQAARNNRDITNGTMLSFFSDGVFSEVKGTGQYHSGKWKQVNSTTVSVSDSAASNTVLINLETINEKHALTILNPALHTRLKYIKYGEGLKDVTEDPFYPDNNLWRKKPKGPENDSLLHTRLGNYFQHLLYILKSSEEREKETVLFAFSLGIVKIYSGGIGLEAQENVPASWKAGYYNYEEAFIAYKMFEQYLKKSRYNGKGTGNWVEDDYRILLNIYGDLKENKFLSRKELQPENNREQVKQQSK